MIAARRKVAVSVCLEKTVKLFLFMSSYLQALTQGKQEREALFALLCQLTAISV